MVPALLLLHPIIIRITLARNCPVVQYHRHCKVVPRRVVVLRWAALTMVVFCTLLAKLRTICSSELPSVTPPRHHRPRKPKPAHRSRS
uniref:Putative secreted peptide n=1 Tax=Anopheles braziliensis TaxID=58242 RepID=A0A2M3ZVH6_9DIPT